jgi:phage/plasmid-associated DNA primase
MRKSKRIYKQKNNSAIDFAESYLVTIFNSEQSVPFKDVYDRYQGFCLSEGIKRAFSKKDFRSALEYEGYLVENSSKHSNQLRIFATKLEVLN